MTSRNSAKCTLWCTRLLVLVIIVLCFTLYDLIRWYEGFRFLLWQVKASILLGYYCCVPLVLYALWCMDRLVSNILKNAVFITANVRFLRRIRWCCAGVSAVTLAAGCFYPPLLFLSVIMAFLALTVSVVKNVMAAAVEIREENDLTV